MKNFNEYLEAVQHVVESKEIEAPDKIPNGVSLMFDRDLPWRATVKSTEHQKYWSKLDQAAKKRLMKEALKAGTLKKLKDGSYF